MRKSISQQIIDTCLAMDANSINQGSAGNVSARFVEGFLITPSGMAYDRLVPDDIVCVGMDGSAQGRLTPSSAWLMHLEIYAARPDAGSVPLSHSTPATALPCLRQDIPALHYLAPVAGGLYIKFSY